MQYVLQTPLQKSDLAPLKAGDTVLLDTHGGDLYQSGPAAYLASLT